MFIYVYTRYTNHFVYKKNENEKEFNIFCLFLIDVIKVLSEFFIEHYRHCILWRISIQRFSYCIVELLVLVTLSMYSAFIYLYVYNSGYCYVAYRLLYYRHQREEANTIMIDDDLMRSCKWIEGIKDYFIFGLQYTRSA